MDTLSRVGAFFVAPLATMALGTAAVKAENSPKILTPENPVTVVQTNNKAASLLSSPSPTNPNPPTGDQVQLLSRPPVFVAQAPRQVAQGNEQGTPPPLPENYGTSGAKVIVELQGDINRNNQIIKQNDQNLVNQMQQNDDRLQQFLRNRQQK
jgi:hypothetical protein